MGGPNGAAYSISDSGWMMDSNFENWFLNIFVKFTENYEKPVLLTYDGHNSHLTYSTIKTAMDNDIIILCLPPNTSHALQPLDVGIFRPVKVAWKKIFNEWYVVSRMQSVDKAVFPTLLGKLWHQLNPTHAINAFRGAGMYPADRNAVFHRVVGAREDHQCSPRPSTSRRSSNDYTPRKILRRSILNVISPPASEETKQAAQQKKTQRKRVQAKTGEVLTEQVVLERLKKEELERQEKKTRNKMLPKKIQPKKSVKRRIVVESDSDSDLNSCVTSIKDSGSDNYDNFQDSKEFKEGVTYVIVKYEGSYFPGIVAKVGKASVTVNCMTKSGPKTWKWPDRLDTCEYTVDAIVKIIPTPMIQGTRGQFSVPEIEKYWC
jgi:hypothetical protein